MRAPSPTRLLFIEDVASEVELAVRQFAQRGIAVEWRRVDTEVDLREQLATFAPHVVLSDFSMPRLDGLTALACVHAHDADLPFLYLSGTIGEERAIEALHCGAMDYVLKDNLARLVPAVERAQREANLVREQRRAAQQLRDIVETSQDWIWELDADRRIVFTSPSVEAILGHHSDHVCTSDLLNYVTPEFRERIHQRLAALDAQDRSVRFLMPCLAKDGHRRWLETNALALVDGGGPVIGFRGSSRDVTEREEQQRRLAHLKRVLRMVSGINGALVRVRDRDPLLHEACRIAVHVGGYTSAAVSLLEPGQTLQVVATAGPFALPVGSRAPLSIPDSNYLSTTAHAILAKKPIVARDRADPGESGTPADRTEYSALGAVAAIPLLVDQTVVGAITLCSASDRSRDPRELRLLQEVAANVSFALQYFDRQTTVHYLSYFDQLTGLAMRTLFCERVDQQLARRLGPEARPAIVALDIERLGLINDSAGRHAGDGLLQRVADRLRRHVDDTDCLAHLGAGVFALSLPLLGSPETALSLVHERIAGLFAKPFEVHGHTIRAAGRCGIACFPADGSGATTLLEHAEAALRNAKATGESFQTYQLQMHRGNDRRLSLEQRLRAAVEERQFVLHYQPKVDIKTCRLVGLEALLRWDEPGKGLVAPSEFMAVLETTQLIVEVGDWVIQQAVADLRRWSAANLSVRIAINVSPWELMRKKFAGHLLDALRGAPTGGQSGLDIEITESALLQDPDDALSKLSLLRSAGVGVALDDFGTGYSSLSRLSHLPVDTLKIDRSFVAELPANGAATTIVSTIINLARAFSLTTVAEGVETTGQLRSLRTLGCDQSQGYIHGRPVSWDAMSRILVASRDASLCLGPVDELPPSGTAQADAKAARARSD